MCRAILALALIVGAVPAAAGRDHVLVRYDFDEETVETGPYTLMVFEHSAGTVELSETYRYSGYRSVEIRDVAGDEDFTELQGYFADRISGKLFLHFALMAAEPAERFNVAFAGTAHFNEVKSGLGVWLKARDGVMLHRTSGEDLPLFELDAFAWYVFDVSYDIDAGSYDLTVREENRDEPLVELFDQPNVSGEPGSMIHKFSFIGDVPWMDGSNAHFFVDDLSISADRPVRQGPFVAPGRRMLFVDMWDHYRRLTYKKPGCPPILGHSDFGLTPRDLQELDRAGLLGRVNALIDGRSKPQPIEEPVDALEQTLAGIELWRQGCRRTSSCDAACREELLARSEALLPDAKLLPMCRVMALAEAGEWAAADELFVSIYPDWHDDPRFPSIAAVLGLARERLDDAEYELAAVPEEVAEEQSDEALRRLWSGRLDRFLVDLLKQRYPDSWSLHVATALSAEHRFYVLLWQRRHDEAARYAERMSSQMTKLGLSPGRWIERRGDASFYAGDYSAALDSYSGALPHLEYPASALLKLSDVHFKLGNLEDERAYRQKIYGTLEPRWTRRDPEPGLDLDRCQRCPDTD